MENEPKAPIFRYLGPIAGLTDGLKTISIKQLNLFPRTKAMLYLFLFPTKLLACQQIILNEKKENKQKTMATGLYASVK